MVTRIAVALGLTLAAVAVRAQPPALADVLGRAASYVDSFGHQLTGIAADETYVQSMGIPGRHGEFIPTTERTLTATLVLMREGDEGYFEARDVREVDGVTVRDRAGSLAARAASEAALWSRADKMRLRSDNARYNIGDVVRTINTPLLALQVLRRQNQSRFSFATSRDRSASVAAAGGDTPGVSRVSTDVWVIRFRERSSGTLIRTEAGRDVPCHGRLWIDAGTGRVMMTEIIVDSRQVQARVTVSFKSEPLLGLLPPVEMHERYRASVRNQMVIEASASYGPFHLLTSQTPQ